MVFFFSLNGLEILWYNVCFDTIARHLSEHWFLSTIDIVFLLFSLVSLVVTYVSTGVNLFIICGFTELLTIKNNTPSSTTASKKPSNCYLQVYLYSLLLHNVRSHHAIYHIFADGHFPVRIKTLCPIVMYLMRTNIIKNVLPIVRGASTSIVFSRVQC